MLDCLVAYDRIAFGVEVLFIRDHEHKALDQLGERRGPGAWRQLCGCFDGFRLGLLVRELVGLRRQLRHERSAGNDSFTRRALEGKPSCLERRAAGIDQIVFAVLLAGGLLAPVVPDVEPFLGAAGGLVQLHADFQPFLVITIGVVLECCFA